MLRVIFVVLAMVLSGCLQPTDDADGDPSLVDSSSDGSRVGGAQAGPSNEPATNDPATPSAPAAPHERGDALRDPIHHRGLLLAPDAGYHDAGFCGAYSAVYSAAVDGVTSEELRFDEDIVGWRVYFDVEGLVATYLDEQRMRITPDEPHTVPGGTVAIQVCNTAMPAGVYGLTLIPPERVLDPAAPGVVVLTGQLYAPEPAWRTNFGHCQHAGGALFDALRDGTTVRFDVSAHVGWNAAVVQEGIVLQGVGPTAPAGIVGANTIYACSSSAVAQEFQVLLAP